MRDFARDLLNNSKLFIFGQLRKFSRNFLRKVFIPQLNGIHQWNQKEFLYEITEGFFKFFSRKKIMGGQIPKFSQFYEKKCNFTFFFS